MHNFWIIARHEYRKIVLRKGFLIGIVGIPFADICCDGRQHPGQRHGTG
jgi:ABC-type Na+ efflux pump permease subunit